MLGAWRPPPRSQTSSCQEAVSTPCCKPHTYCALNSKLHQAYARVGDQLGHVTVLLPCGSENGEPGPRRALPRFCHGCVGLNVMPRQGTYSPEKGVHVPR